MKNFLPFLLPCMASIIRMCIWHAIEYQDIWLYCPWSNAMYMQIHTCPTGVILHWISNLSKYMQQSRYQFCSFFDRLFSCTHYYLWQRSNSTIVSEQINKWNSIIDEKAWKKAREHGVDFVVANTLNLKKTRLFNRHL